MKLQLELGSIANPYEPYTEDVAYIPDVGELRRLLNGVFDELDVVRGIKTQRTKEKILVADDISFIVDNTNTVHAATIALSDAVAFTNVANQKKVLVDGMSEVTATPFDDESNIGKFFLQSSNRVYFVFAKGTTLEQAKAALAGKSLNYQLANEVVTPVDVIGEVRAAPNGTIFVEPCLSGFMTAATKVITTEDLPISAIRKVVRFDISSNGQLIKTDVTDDVAIGDNNTSLTIANYMPGKTYFYDCEYPAELTTKAEIIADVEVDNGIITHDYAAASADWTLDANEARATMLICTNAGGAARIIAPACDGKLYVIKNDSGQTITIKTASSTGVTVATGKTATVIYTGTDFIKIAEV